MRPLILITNDDGVLSPGLHALAEAVLDLGDVLISAPVGQQTSASRSKRRTAETGRIEQVPLRLAGREHIGYGVHGTPAIAVLHGVLEIGPTVFGRRPDICLSGINYGENIGYSLTTGGTVGAAMEAGAFQIPALAFSQVTPMTMNHSDEYAALDWRGSQAIAAELTAQTLRHALPAGVGLLNVNVPDDASAQTPWRWTRQSALNYYQWSGVPREDWSQPHRLRVDKIAEGCEPGSDVHALVVERMISVTPLSRNLTVSQDFSTFWSK
jgi:5'-nucleotidase